MVLATVFYTAANLCVKALAHLPTQELVFLRSVISLVLTGGWLWWNGYSLFGVNRKWLLIRGIFGTIGLATFFHTLRFIPIASATVIQYLSLFPCCSPVTSMANARCGRYSGCSSPPVRSARGQGFDPDQLALFQSR